eukprot:Phypoly_transcript_01250.p1 GENE.Phypoly_transcript_01250~~Phypoly_transcript_01250.p1  ORF type:complete len:1141 (+),score=298.60 Phypoly_transcript_01250:98-3520(+)
MEELLESIKPLLEVGGSGTCDQPPGIKATMRNHQLVGLNWLISRYENKINCILGDEMGVGKTLQAIAMLSYLQDEKKIRGPFLVVCPLSILQNWQDELSKFAPKLVVKTYIGDKDEREDLRSGIVDEILKLPKSQQKDPQLSFNVLLTTYDMIISDFEFLSSFKWRYAVLDEAHKLKNSGTVLYKTFQSEFKLLSILLMTGTPVQNNLQELHCLLHFLMPKLFTSTPVIFESWFVHKKGKKQKQAGEAELEPEAAEVLHEILRPFFLRRTKEEVLKDLPPKSEIILYSGMSAMQKKYYKWILTKDVNALASTAKTTLMNIIVQLRKCCNHPYLFEGAEPMFDGEYVLGDHIISNSGKMVLLDKLLQKLKKEGHRVLIFSQMTRTLDILQDYLHYRNYTYERLDGSVRGEERFLAVKNFTEQNEAFVFLLSTRAGGLGLNLTQADTVIFFDSDYNPQSDLQAQARVHRIGQTKPVKVIRLVAAQTVEELILKRAFLKLRLTHAVIDEGGFSLEQEIGKYVSGGLTEVLKYGLKEMVGNQESNISDEDIDAILEKGVEVSETANLKKIDDAANEATPDSMYIYEGQDFSQDYTLQEEDEQEFKNIMALKTPKSPKAPLHDDDGSKQVELRKRKIMYNDPEQQEKKKAKLEEKKKKKWADNKKKKKKKILSDEKPPVEDDEMGYISDFSESEEEKDINYVTGDATKPIRRKGPCIILNCLDDSGNWGRGGFFWAIAKLSPAPQANYELASEMGDIHLGDAHLVQIDDSTYVANIIVQSRDKKGNISGLIASHLELALRKVAQAAKTLHASVHMPRIGAGTPGFKWYTAEHLIRKILVIRQIDVYVYYFSRAGAQHKGGPHTNTTTTTTSSPAKPHKKHTKSGQSQSQSDSDSENNNNNNNNNNSSKNNAKKSHKSGSQGSQSSDGETAPSQKGKKAKLDFSKMNDSYEDDGDATEEDEELQKPIKEKKKKQNAGGGSQDTEGGDKEENNGGDGDENETPTKKGTATKTETPTKKETPAKKETPTKKENPAKKDTSAKNSGSPTKPGAMILNPLPDVFVGSVIYLSFKDEEQANEIKRQIVAFGGIIAPKPSLVTTHVISDGPITDEVLLKLKEDNDDIKFVNTQWVKDSIAQQREIATDKYLL